MKIRQLGGDSLNLKNDGNLSLFFVGVGAAFSKKHYQTNLLVIKGEHHILIDCGTRCPEALWKLGMRVTDIETLLITHSHADHIGGLEEVALVNRYFAKKKVPMIINETYEHILWDMSLRGGCAYSEEEFGKKLGFGDFFIQLRPRWLINMPRETLEIEHNGINIKLVRTKHIPDSATSWETSFWSCGVIIDNRVLFTSDTRFDEDLIKDFDDIFNFELIIHDCQLFTGGVHASYEELKGLPDKYKSRILLSHYGDNWEEFSPEKDGFIGFARQHVYYDL